jgi:HTH-type transcriptional regulator, cell division transcriptional repressor
MGQGASNTRKRNIIGARVRLARQNPKCELTQDQLSGRLAALLVPIDRAAIAKIELGQRRVCDFEVIALAEVLKVDVKWLLGLE